jgi:hypothetical protein
MTVTRDTGGGVSVMRLSEMQVRQTKPGPKPQRMTDGHGMFLLVTTNGQKRWRFNYRFKGKRCGL